MKNKSKRLIYIEEYVLINGINQYLFHSGTKYDNQVLLFLHGGPGSAESLFAHVFQQKWEDIFTVVHWDQRGSGKTLTNNPDKYPTIDLMLKDLFEIIQYLKKKYNKQKIIILGHSWGSVLGSTFIKKYPDEVAYYIGVGQVISMIENERVGYEKVKELILQSNDKKSLKKLQVLGDYPGDKFDSEFMKKCGKIRRLQGKYNLAMKIGLSMIIAALKSPIFKLSDILALIKGPKVNEEILEFLFPFDLNAESGEYKVPIYYILGGNDWQTPYVIAQEYFSRINAPHKNLYLIPNAGHMTMMDQPQLFFDVLLEINNKEIYDYEICSNTSKK
ncbi:alpha/beta hydrolase [Clostridium algoriphilum]|uniref:alpha/beta fold hydrolase n=1 Tax=Clostridium algoriphilum TaxID=198347 RepID=UPI001CF3C554|nr:alpha/beta hydrolase [Clostridium algoriphilum]MCB2294006.1 alpha/beta hydrolase [Clostridium algoriphilum]